MIGLDTNVLVRLNVHDDAGQLGAASSITDRLSPAEPAFVNLVVLVEFAWVLRSRYDVPRQIVFDAVEDLLMLRDVVVEKREVVEEALVAGRANAVDFADALIALVNAEAGCRHTLTFDKRAARLPQIERV